MQEMIKRLKNQDKPIEVDKKDQGDENDIFDEDVNFRLNGQNGIKLYGDQTTFEYRNLIDATRGLRTLDSVYNAQAEVSVTHFLIQVHSFQ